MGKLISNEKIIKSILSKDEESRDNDMRLLALVWYNHIKNTYSSRVLSKSEELLKLISKSGVPHFESIRRTRQQLQKENKPLRGKKYIERQKRLEKEVKQEIINRK